MSNIDKNEENKENYDIDEISEDLDLDLNEEDNELSISEKFDLLYHFNTNKHKQEGKHRLKRDTIFKGRIDNRTDDEICGNSFDQDDYNDLTSFFNYESENYTNNIEQNNLTTDVYDVLNDKTDLDFSQNRRKPNRETFNNYYDLLLNDLGFRYTKSEIFVELSYYFTDNIFNMFKLLDKRPATIIIKELSEKGYLTNLDGINFL
jgi:hypothetical protein